MLMPFFMTFGCCPIDVYQIRYCLNITFVFIAADLLKLIFFGAAHANELSCYLYALNFVHELLLLGFP